jgi:hypothetical protein
VTNEIAEQLHGWMMCTVMVQPLVTGRRPFSKTVRWQRESAAALITGFNALLSSLTLELDATPSDCVAPLATARTPRRSSTPNGPWNPR